MLHCSNPDTASLLEALNPVFNLNSIRPVVNITTVTNVSIYPTVYAILGVVNNLFINLKPNQYEIICIPIYMHKMVQKTNMKENCLNEMDAN